MVIKQNDCSHVIVDLEPILVSDPILLTFSILFFSYPLIKEVGRKSLHWEAFQQNLLNIHVCANLFNLYEFTLGSIILPLLPPYSVHNQMLIILTHSECRAVHRIIGDVQRNKTTTVNGFDFETKSTSSSGQGEVLLRKSDCLSLLGHPVVLD